MAECKIGLILSGDEAREDEKQALADALMQKTENDHYVWSAKKLATQVTNKTRFAFGATTVKEHRGQRCPCFNG